MKDDTTATLQKPKRLNLISGKWVPANSGKEMEVVSPIDGEVFAQIAESDAAHIDAAVTAARDAFDGGPWSELTAAERDASGAGCPSGFWIMPKIWPNSKPAKTASRSPRPSRHEADRTVFRNIMAAPPTRCIEKSCRSRRGTMSTCTANPTVITGHIIPCNFPAQMFDRSIAPALATGNATALKPAEYACLTALSIASLAQEVGFSPGAINSVTGRGNPAGQALADHKGIDFFYPSPGRPRSARLFSGPRPRTSSGAPWNWAASRHRSCSRMPTWTRHCPSLSTR